jgi:hypothetical protein
MGDLKIGTKSVFTQSGGAEPVLASTVTGGAGLSGMTSLGTVTTGTYNANIGSSATFPAGHIIKINSFHDETQTSIAGNGTGVEILDIDFTAKASNSAYYLSMTIGSTNNDVTGSADAGDRGVTAWLEDSGASDKYRFGSRKTSDTRHDVLVAANDYYQIWDSDGGIGGNTWHQWPLPFSWISGNQPTYESTTVVNSNFTAGETITLKVWVASSNGAYINRSNMSSSANASTSHYCVIEVAT